MANSFKQAQQEALALIQQIEVEVSKLDAQLTTSASKISKMLTATSGANSVQDQLKGFNAEMKRLNEIVSKQETQIKSLTNARTQLSKKTSEEVVNQRALAKASDLEATSKSKIVGAYQRLNAQRGIAKKKLQDLIVAKGKDNALTKKAQREYDKLTAKVNQANKATSNFSKTGLGGLAKGFKNLVGAFGVAGATIMFAQFAQSGFKLAKQLDSLGFAMRTIITDSEELERTQFFLADITQRYGAELVTTTERYIKFLTAAKQSNVSLQDTEQIFRSVTKAAGVLGLSTEELNGTYLALEQMLSKGKVTTEELRRQLGERLPGAFGIMADAIGVSVEELDKLLKKGEILSADALPKFAEALEKAYGIENIENVRTLQAETSRLSNAWTRFVQTVSNSEGRLSKTLMGILSFITQVVSGFELMALSQEEYEKKLSGSIINKYYNDAKKSLKEMGDEAEDFAISELSRLDDRIESTQNLINKLEEENKIVITKSGNAVESNRKQINSQKEVLNGYKGMLKAVEELLNLTDKTNEKVVEETDGRRTLSVVMKELSDAQLELNESTKEEAPSILAKIKLLQEEAKAWKDSNDSRKKAKELIEGTVDWYEKEISALKEKRDALSKNNEQYEKFNEEIDKLQNALDKITGSYKEFINIIDSANEGTEKSEELINNLVLGFDSWQRSLDDSSKSLDKATNKVKNFLRSFSDEAMSDFGFNTLNELLTLEENGKSVFDNLMDNADNAAERFGIAFTSITEVGQEMFNLLNSQQDAYFENQLFRLEQERDIAIQFAGDSATAREEIERQYEEKRRAIQQKQAEAQREQALFNILINTAQGVVAALTSTPPNVPLSIAVGLIGAVQAGLVASTPIPQFFRGTMNAPEGWAMVDEKRPEIHTDNKGNIKSFGESGANMRYLDRGDKIYTSRETYFQKELGGILEGNDILPYNQMFDMVAPAINIDSGLRKEDFIREIRGMRSDIMKKETSVININKSGFTSSIIKGNSKVNNQNNILTLKGGTV